MNKYFRKRLNISRLAINYPWLTISFWMGITVAGLLAFSSLKYALFPDVTFPVVIVNTSSNLENIIETESKLTQPLEQSFLSIEGIDQVYSSTFSGQTVINSFFVTSENLTSSQEKIKLALEKVSLPTNTSVEVIPFNLNESSAISYAITSNTKNLAELETITREKIIPPLEKIAGVLQVNLLGIISDGDNQISNNTSNISTLVKFNGENALAIQIVKKADANTLDVVEKVQQAIKQITPQIPSIQLVLAKTEANFIQEATQSTIEALILAIILAVFVIFIFLGNFPATLITAVSIPISFLGTCIVMAIAHLNLETITLLALALVIGIVVDDAIVDIENITRHLEKGESPKQAAIAATDEIGLTVTASTLSIVAVFLPVALMGGTIGQFFKPFGLTVSAAVIISLLVARTLSPVLAIYWLKPRDQKVSLQIPFLVKLGKLTVNKYQSLLSWSLRHRKTVLLLAIVSVLVGIGLIPFIPKGFIPQLDRGEFNIVYTTKLPKITSSLSFNKANNSDYILSKESNFNWLGNIQENANAFLLRRTRRIGEKIEKVVLGQTEVESTFTVVGIQQQPNKGIIHVQLKENRTTSTAKAKEKIRNSLPEIKGTNISVEDIKFIESGDEKPLKFALISDNLATLHRTSQKIQKQLKQQPYLVDVSSSEIQENIKEEKDVFIIEHKNGKRVTFISANFPEGEVIGNVTKKVTEIVKPLLPSNVQLELEGDSARVSDIMADFGITLSISVTLMLLILLTLFGRLLEPLVVGLSLPLSMVGAMLALLITRSDFGMVSLIGLIFLVGLSDKNALLLVDYANQLRGRGLKRDKAILETGKARLRPILMTTFSTILGMLPIAIGWGAGAELRQPMAVAIIGGLLTSSILSLVFVPVFDTLLEDVWVKIFLKRKKIRKPPNFY